MVDLHHMRFCVTVSEGETFEKGKERDSYIPTALMASVTAFVHASEQ